MGFSSHDKPKGEKIIDTSTEAIITTDLDTRITYWNPAAEDLCGYTSQDVLGTSILTLFKQADKLKLETLISQSLNGEILRNSEFTIIDKLNNERIVLLSVTPLKDSADNITELVLFLKDITEIKDIQNKLNRLNLLFEDSGKTAKVGGWELDVETRQITFTNQTFDIYELPYGKTPTVEEGISYYHPDHRQIISDAVTNAIEHHKPYNIEVKLITANKNEIWVQTKGNPIVKNNKVVRLYGSIQDITERKLIEEANTNLTLKMKEAYNLAKLGWWELEAETNDMTWSDNLFEIFGFDSNSTDPDFAEVMEKNVHPEDSPRLYEKISSALSEGIPYDIKLRIIRSDGSSGYIESRAEAARDENGKIVKLIGTSLDITDRIASQMALEESEKRFQNMASNLVGAIFQYVLRADGTDAVIYMSPRCIDLWEVDAETVTKNAKILWDMVHPDDLEPMYASVLKSAKTLEPWLFQWRITTPSGKQKWLEAAGRPEKKDNGDVLWDSLIMDVTKRKLAEIELQNALNEVTALKNKYEKENIYLKEEIGFAFNYQNLIYASDEISEVLNQVDMVAGTDATVLLQGETGTGKEIIARAIHINSRRYDKAFIKVNCAAIPQELIESELFGHVKGSFTGAINNRIGKFELADGGTIFLDEIGELPIDMQPKLLRVLQEGEIEPIGSSKLVKINVRVIAATNRNLLKEIEKGNFREDLFFRLNVFPISIPPLRERRDDIPVLINHFVSKFSEEYRKEFKHILKEDLEKLMNYKWPGNVRELENLIERSVIVSKGDHISFSLGSKDKTDKKRVITSIGQTLNDVQREHIIRVLKKTGWKITGSEGAAVILDIKPSTLRDRMKKLNIQRP